MNDEPLSASSYLKYLPALYGRPGPDGEPPFLSAFLKIFEKLLSGNIEPPAWQSFPVEPPYLTRKGIRQLLEPQVIGTLFHPRLSFLFADDPAFSKTFIPTLSIGKTAGTSDNVDKLKLLATYIGADGTLSVKAWLNAFLDWMAGTVALDVDGAWAIDTKRFVIAQALPLFRARGTLDGMTWLLNAWFGLDSDAPVLLVPHGSLKVLKISVSNVGFEPIRVCDSPQADAFLLEDDIVDSTSRLPDIVCYEQDPHTRAERVVGYRARHFIVSIVTVVGPDGLSPADEASLDRFKTALAGVVDEFKPALTDYDIVIEGIHLPPPPSPPMPHSPTASGFSGLPDDGK